MKPSPRSPRALSPTQSIFSRALLEKFCFPKIALKKRLKPPAGERATGYRSGGILAEAHVARSTRPAMSSDWHSHLHSTSLPALRNDVALSARSGHSQDKQIFAVKHAFNANVYPGVLLKQREIKRARVRDGDVKGLAEGAKSYCPRNRVPPDSCSHPELTATRAEVPPCETPVSIVFPAALFGRDGQSRYRSWW